MTATTLLYSQLIQTITPPSPKTLPPTNSKLFAYPPSLTPEQQPTKVSPLLALPFELRLQIYTHALTLHTPTTPKTPTHDHMSLFQDTVSTSLLLVNRQIYHEARLLPFSTNTIIFTKCFGSSVFCARKFLMRLEPWQRAALRNMEISVVGREIVESWRRLEGWEAVVRMLDGCKRCVVRVNLREEDVRIQAGEDGGGDGGWLANGGDR